MILGCVRGRLFLRWKSFPSRRRPKPKLNWPPASFDCLAKRIYLIACPIAHHTLHTIQVCIWRTYRCISTLPLDSLKSVSMENERRWPRRLYPQSKITSWLVLKSRILMETLLPLRDCMREWSMIAYSEMSHFYFTSYLNHDLAITNDVICKLILTCKWTLFSFKSAKDIDDYFYICIHILFQGDW